MKRRQQKAFTLVEVAVTILVVSLIVGSVMTILDRLVGAMVDMRLYAAAFDTARQKMESLLSLPKVEDTVEYGISDTNPDIQWQVTVEPFYEPINNAMWVRAVCSAGYTDSKGDYQSVELEHWLTNLQGSVVRQIIQQEKAEEEYLDLMNGTAAGREEAAIQETTIAYLQEAGLDVDEYTSFLERQRRNKLDYISKHGFDEGYDQLVEEMREDENVFLDRLGMKFDEYNEFAKTYEPTYVAWGRSTGSGRGGSGGTGTGGNTGGSSGDGGGNPPGSDGNNGSADPGQNPPTENPKGYRDPEAILADPSVSEDIKNIIRMILSQR